MKAMLLRVAIDKGTDGALGPIFEDGSFEYIPISEDPDCVTKETGTYKNTIGRNGKSFSTYLSKGIWNRILHFDPEFATFTYGDPTPKRKDLLKLEKDDLLVFYAGLTPYNNNKWKEALYIIGYFAVDRVLDFNKLTNKEIKECCKLYSNNAHLKLSRSYDNLVIIVGQKDKSKLLDKAILISEKRSAKNNMLYDALSKKMEISLGISGFIYRSLNPKVIKGEDNINNLKRILNLQNISEYKRSDHVFVSVIVYHPFHPSLLLRLENHPLEHQPQNYRLFCQRPAPAEITKRENPQDNIQKSKKWEIPVTDEFIGEMTALFKTPIAMKPKNSMLPYLILDGPPSYEVRFPYYYFEETELCYKWKGSPPDGWEPLAEIVDRLMFQFRKGSNMCLIL
jgi:hypothetical protein